MMRSRWILLPLLLMLIPVTLHAQEPDAPLILVPVVRDGKPAELAAADGAMRSVLRIAPDSMLTAGIRRVFATPFIKQALRLEGCARRFRMHELAEQNKSDSDEWRSFAEPLYLLLSSEEGGFARRGFWLEEASGARRYVAAGYVDMVVDEDSVADGSFEEIFAHEMAHVVLRTLLGEWPAGPSRKPHLSMTVTDYPTAFDEGYAEHFQPLVRDHTTNTNLQAFERGAGQTNLNTFWQSSIDRRLRVDGARRNLFIHDKAVSVISLTPSSDRYQLFLSGESSSAFAMEALRNGQQMMASEGVVATIFYRLVNDERLQKHYRETAFYEPFTRQAAKAGVARETFNGYENINLKLYAAISELRRKPLTADRPLMLELVAAYGRLFADEKAIAYEIFINTTMGATASAAAVPMIEQLARDGQTGDAAFISALPKARKFFAELIGDAASDRVALDANLGRELWILNRRFRTGRSALDGERTIPLTTNLNTATISELMTLPGVSSEMARRIIESRKAQGYFQSLDDLRRVSGASVALITMLKKMQQAMRTAGGFARQ